MKGVTHFLSGVAVASCFPAAMRSALADQSFLLPIGGIFGILPDTLDFKFARYFWKHDHIVRLTEENLDPKVAAEAVAQAIDQAWREKRPVRLRLDSIRVSCSYYRTYNIFIDDKKQEIVSVLGPLKNMGQIFSRFDNMPSEQAKRRDMEEHGVAATLINLGPKAQCLPGTMPEGAIAATVPFTAPVVNTYYQETEVGVFHGPDFEFLPEGDHIRIDFIPWHRRWTHAFTTALCMAPFGYLLYAGGAALFGAGAAAFSNPMALLAGLIAVLAFATHVIEDQIGVLGSNLFPPFTKFRSQGLKWITSISPLPNAITNYLAVITILWNMNAYAPVPSFRMPWAARMTGDFATTGYYLVSLLNYAVYAFAIPVGLLYVVARVYHKYYLKTREVVLDDEFDTAEMAAESRDF